MYIHKLGIFFREKPLYDLEKIWGAIQLRKMG